MLVSAVQCSAVQCSAVQCSAGEGCRVYMVCCIVYMAYRVYIGCIDVGSVLLFLRLGLTLYRLIGLTI